MPEPVAVAVFAKAPAPGYAKTRLIPLIGVERAAALQERLTERAVLTAVQAAIGPVTLWCAPDVSHPSFHEIARRLDIGLAMQPGGDLGRRMLAAFEAVASGLVLIGSDCPCLEPQDLEAAADALRNDADVALAEAEDGGYGLIAAQRAQPALFRDMPWGTDQVAALTIARAGSAGLRLARLRTIWDVDTPADYRRLLASGLLSPDAPCTSAASESDALLHLGNINKAS
jgi:uncharacterized protein